jgi:predicted metal-dependent RNase
LTVSAAFPSALLIVCVAPNCRASPGGRVRHHLKHNLWRPESSIVFVGYAASGTLARSIIDGAKEVNLLGEQIQVRVRIYTINGFPAWTRPNC